MQITSECICSSIEIIYQDSISKINRIRDLMKYPIKETKVLNWKDNKDLNIIFQVIGIKKNLKMQC